MCGISTSALNPRIENWRIFHTSEQAMPKSSVAVEGMIPKLKCQKLDGPEDDDVIGHDQLGLGKD